MLPDLLRVGVSGWAPWPPWPAAGGRPLRVCALLPPHACVPAVSAVPCAVCRQQTGECVWLEPPEAAGFVDFAVPNP